MIHKLGLVVFTNHSGLGAQTRRLAEMLQPDKLLAIDASSFSQNKQNRVEWYRDFVGHIVKGFPSDREMRVFMRGLSDVLVCENPLNFHMLSHAKQNGIRVYIQSNYEFCDHLDKKLELPYKFLMPSHWKVDAMKERFDENMIEYLPPPINPQEFLEARKKNLSRTKPARFELLHVVGTLAAMDRNGTLDLIKAVPHIKSNFRLTITAQRNLPPEYYKSAQKYADKLVFKIGDIDNQNDLYQGFDALILPRRYGGLSLTTNEALMSGMPVLMPNISPNNELLPKEWLFPCEKNSQFFGRTVIDVYSSKPEKIAEKIDWLASQDIEKLKSAAYDIALSEFDSNVLLPKYEKLLCRQ